MKTSITSNLRPLLRAFYPLLIAIAVLWAMPKNANAQVYVLQINPASGTVSEYSTKGDLINANFITGLNEIFGLAVSDNKLFVCTGTEKKGMFVFTVGKYDVTTGAAISANFIKRLNLLAAKGNT